ncbi:hypothetical protein ABL78_6856 [Leptomonas seymouri]|uniref:Uncharacterized protein n=1 Tax=Leptomonas seymouri TaxID=5684 RepID=A0A0N1I097_LEPSE|nr:hypothetical protein ABL78_6856 [Leptomonas seymouri]|eukprot:KPI84078.1 hypothetical protein ABL78_6856 [Leptomonas seymouri]
MIRPSHWKRTPVGRKGGGPIAPHPSMAEEDSPAVVLNAVGRRTSSASSRALQDERRIGSALPLCTRPYWLGGQTNAVSEAPALRGGRSTLKYVTLMKRSKLYECLAIQWSYPPGCVLDFIFTSSLL